MKRDLYAEVSARIVAELEAGAIPASVRLMPSSPFDLLASRRPAEPLHPRFSAGLATRRLSLKPDGLSKYRASFRAFLSGRWGGRARNSLGPGIADRSEIPGRPSRGLDRGILGRRFLSRGASVRIDPFGEPRRPVYLSKHIGGLNSASVFAARRA
jgi:hypothetical protein